jgi:hypothetical protein
MKKMIVSFLLLLLFGCTSVQQSTRISSSIHAMQFNHVASKYMERPTFVSIEQMSDGESVLAVDMINYGPQQSSNRFSKKHVDTYISLIDKYLKWADLAKKNSDQLTKEIGDAPTWANMSTGTLKFTFYSGNQFNHYLEISFCAVGTCLEDQSLYFDEDNAKKLKQLLSNFSSGKIDNIDTSKLYN